MEIIEMKNIKFIFFIVLAAASMQGFAQTIRDDSTKYINYKFQYGIRYPRLQADSILHIPYRDTTSKPQRPGAILLNSLDNKFYTWDGSAWNQVSGAGGGSYTPSYGILTPGSLIKVDTLPGRIATKPFVEAVFDSTRLPVRSHGHGRSPIIQVTGALGLDAVTIMEKNGIKVTVTSDTTWEMEVDSARYVSWERLGKVRDSLAALIVAGGGYVPPGGATALLKQDGTTINAAATKSFLSLDNVENTTDANKPISTATASALAGKQPTLVSNTNIKTVAGTSLLGSGDVTPTLDQALGAGATLTTNRTINQSGRNLTYSGGGAIIQDSLRLVANISPLASNATKVTGAGDSFTFGIGTTNTDSIYVNLFGKSLSLPVTNLGVSSTTTKYSVTVLQANVNYPHTSITTMMAGFNDIAPQDVTLSANRRVVNQMIANYKAAFFNQYASTPIGASDASVTRTGSWNTSWDATIECGKMANAAYTTAAGATISFTKTDSTIFVQLFGITGTGTSITVQLDGVNQSVPTALLDAQNDGSMGNYSPILIAFSGLTYASHTLKVINNNATLLICDYFSSFIPNGQSMPMIISHIPYRNATGLGSTFGTNAATNFINGKIDSLSAALGTYGRPLIIAKVENFYDPNTSDVSGDNIHPSDQGNRKLFLSFSGAFLSPYTAGKIDYRTDNHLYVDSKKIPFLNDIGLQTVISNNSVLTSPNTLYGSNRFDVRVPRFSVAEIFDVQPSNVKVKGFFDVIGDSATARIFDRSGGSGRFEYFVQGGNMYLVNGYTGRTNSITADHRTFFINNNTPSEQSPTNATVEIAGNYSGAAGFIPFKLRSGVPVSAPEVAAIENDGGHWNYTKDNAVRTFFVNADDSVSTYTTRGRSKKIADSLGALISAVSGFANPMTTTGDIIYSSSGSTAARLPIGSTNQVLTVIGGIPSWQPAASSGVTLLADYRATTAGVMTNTTTPTSISGTGVGSKTALANTLQVGSHVKMHSIGALVTPTSPGFISIGYTNISGSSTLQSATITGAGGSLPLEFDFDGVVVSTGTSGTMRVTFTYRIYQTFYSNTFTLDNINTTINQPFDITAKFQTASDAGNSLTMYNTTIRIEQ